MKFHQSLIMQLSLALVLGLPIAVSAQPDPFPANPEILALAEQVNADSLASSIDLLVSFHTRHTYSDTLSNTAGIGAARRWVGEEFVRHGMEDSLFAWTGSWEGNPHQCYNMSGWYGTGQAGQRLVLLGAHLDSRNVSSTDNTGFAPGADDDGSGVAALIEIGRLLGNVDLGLNVVHTAFTGEEQGLLGSGAMAEAFAEEGQAITAMLNMDMLAHSVFPDGSIDTSTVRIYSAGPAGSSSRQLARYAKWIGEAYADGLTVTLIPAEDRPGRGGDHSSFSDAGYTAIRVIETGEDTDYQHDDTDIPEAMDFNYFRKNVRLVLGVTAALANAGEAPPAAEVVNASDNAAQVAWSPSIRPEGSTMYVAVRRSNETFWQNIYTAGESDTLLIEGLVPDEEYEFSISLQEEGGQPSPFSEETSLVIMDVIPPPDRVEATSTSDGPIIEWDPRPEPFVTEYAIQRAEPGDTSFETVATVSEAPWEYADQGAVYPNIYRYRVLSGNEDHEYGPPSDLVYGALVTHSASLLLVDATPEGTGVPGSPLEDETNAAYWDLFDLVTYKDRFNRSDSLSVGRPLTDADLGQYTVAIVYADALNNNISSDTTAFRKYLQHGGNLIVIGWRLSASIGGATGFNAEFSSGNFLYDQFGIESVEVTPVSDPQFIGATSDQGFDAIEVDDTIYPTLGGRLPIMDMLTLRESGQAYPIYTLVAQDGDESPYQGGISAIMDSREFPNWCMIDIPLSATTPASRQMIYQVFESLGVFLWSINEVDNPNQIDTWRIVGAYPNPFNPVVTCKVSLPQAAQIGLTVDNLLGQEVASLHQGTMAAGEHTFTWDASEQASGIYYLRFQYPGGSHVQKVTLVR